MPPQLASIRIFLHGDKMSATNQGISYLDISEKNILDTRFTGGGKTTSALQFISKAVAEGQPVIVLMQSYVRLENNYLSRFDDDLQSQSLIFKGRTQKDICRYWKELNETYVQGQRPRNECSICDHEQTCGYQKQKAKLEAFVSSNDGFCILTTEHNLNHILSRCESRNPVIIIDDISLSSVINPEINISQKRLSSLFSEMKNPIIQDFIAQLRDYEKGKERDILVSASLALQELSKGLDQYKVSVIDQGTGFKSPSLDVIYTLVDWIKKEHSLHFYSEYNTLKIVAETQRRFERYRIFYLNATPSMKDNYSMKRLGNFRQIHAEVQESKNFFIFQILDSANARQSVLGSTKLPEVFLNLTSIFKKDMEFIDQKLLIFSFQVLLNKWVNDGTLSGSGYVSEIYFGSNTRGTNDYKSFPISVIVGTPYYPPEYFLHPAFESEWRAQEDIERDRVENPGSPLYYVDRKISDREAKTNLLQMIGRTLRDNPLDLDQTKIVVVFSDIKITEDCRKQNGGRVILSGIGAQRTLTLLENNLKVASRKALRKQIFQKISDDIDSRLPSESVKLDEISDTYSQRVSLFAKSTIKNKLAKIYETEIIVIDHEGRKIETKVITKKKTNA